MSERHVLILLSDTGGGHRSVALALTEAFERQAPTAQVTLLDLLHDCTHFPISRAGRHYQFMVQHAPPLWRAVWWMGANPGRLKAFMTLCLPLAAPARRFLSDQPADLVISVHPLLNHLPLRFLREAGNTVPFVTVVTDWASLSPAWLCPQVDLCVVPSEAAAARALACGLRDEQVRVVGIPVSRDFAPADRATTRQRRRQLGLGPAKPTVLLVGGGGGVGSLGRIAVLLADALARAGDGQLVVVCGRNERLRRQLDRRCWPIPVIVKGFVHDMANWMAAADLIVTKAGPSTIAEALAVGLPMLLYGFISGQEEGNVPFVVEQGAGLYIEAPDEIARAVAEWLSPDNPELREMAGRARALGRPSAADAIVQEAMRLLPIS